MNGHGDRWDSGGKHRGSRKPFAIQVALRGFLDRVSGKSPHKDWSGHPLDDKPETGEQCTNCLRFTYTPGYGCWHCGATLPSDRTDRESVDSDYGCPGCGGPSASGEQWCQTCIDEANTQFIGGTQ